MNITCMVLELLEMRAIERAIMWNTTEMAECAKGRIMAKHDLPSYDHLRCHLLENLKLMDNIDCILLRYQKREKTLKSL